jgi:hypothetical protein
MSTITSPSSPASGVPRNVDPVIDLLGGPADWSRMSSAEVVVARRPEVFVRPSSMEDGRKLARISRTARNPVKLRRAIVVLMSGQGQKVRDITSFMQVSDSCVRDVIYAFNERGVAALDPKRTPLAKSGASPSGGGPECCEV